MMCHQSGTDTTDCDYCFLHYVLTSDKTCLGESSTRDVELALAMLECDIKFRHIPNIIGNENIIKDENFIKNK